MAQLVARDIWDVEAAGSNPVTPTKRNASAISYGKGAFRLSRFHSRYYVNS